MFTADLLALLQWKARPERIQDALTRALRLEGEELVKFLQDVLDALFSIFSTEDGNSTPHSGLVFHVLVSRMHLLYDGGVCCIMLPLISKSHKMLGSQCQAKVNRVLVASYLPYLIERLLATIFVPLQVSIFNLLNDSKFEHFKPVMDAYIKDHFAAALVYK